VVEVSLEVLLNERLPVLRVGCDDFVDKSLCFLEIIGNVVVVGISCSEETIHFDIWIRLGNLKVEVVLVGFRNDIETPPCDARVGGTRANGGGVIIFLLIIITRVVTFFFGLFSDDCGRFGKGCMLLGWSAVDMNRSGTIDDFLLLARVEVGPTTQARPRERVGQRCPAALLISARMVSKEGRQGWV
jgi:hypothetical protein